VLTIKILKELDIADLNLLSAKQIRFSIIKAVVAILVKQPLINKILKILALEPLNTILSQ
jgi:hypothetical protein